MTKPAKFYRVNQQISSPQIRLIDAGGKQLGIVSRDEALTRARSVNVDLVEIAPNASPPVVKLIDFKKFLYLEQKRRRLERKRSHASETKEIRLGPFTSAHDLDTKIGKAKAFLADAHKLKIVMKFTGRQIAHPEFGKKTLRFFLDSISSTCKIEREPHFEGKLLIALVSPARGGKDEAKDTKVSSKKI